MSPEERDRLVKQLSYAGYALLFVIAMGTFVIAVMFVKLSDNQKSIAKVSDTIQELNRKVGNLQGAKDGYTPIKGVDYTDGSNGTNGNSGSNGTDSMSTNTTVENRTNTIEQMPIDNYQLWLKAGNVGTIDDFWLMLKGDKGDQGDPASTSRQTLYRLNPDTGALEKKLEGTKDWEPAS